MESALPFVIKLWKSHISVVFHWPGREGGDHSRAHIPRGEDHWGLAGGGWLAHCLMDEVLFLVHSYALLPTCVLSVELICFNNHSWLLRADRGCAPLSVFWSSENAVYN